MIYKFSLFSWLVAAISILLLQPKLELPLMHYPLLMLLHMLLIGVVLIPILNNLSLHGPFEKIAWAFITSGYVILILGFLTAPRTALIKDAGLFITTGITLFLLEYLKRPFSVLFWPSLALIETCLLGYILGNNLNRVSVDPIPFSAISTHAIAGLFLALTPLTFIARLKTQEKESKYTFYPRNLFFATGLLTSLYLYLLPVPRKFPIFLIFVLSIWGISFLDKKYNKLIPVLFSLTIFLILYKNSGVFFEGNIIGLILLGWSFILVFLVWKPSTRLQLLASLAGAIIPVAGLFLQNHLLIFLGCVIQVGIILRIGFITDHRNVINNTHPITEKERSTPPVL